MNSKVTSAATISAALAIAWGGVGALQAVRAQSAMASGAIIGEGNVASIPEGFRHWTFLGAP